MSALPTSAMVFAAGFGSRMRPLTNDRPKPLVQVAGKTLLDHALTPLRDAGIQNIVVNGHYRGDQIADHLDGQADVTVLLEDPILDTGGGLKNALRYLGTGPVITQNSDAVWTGPNPVKTLLNKWDADRMDALMLVIPRARAVGNDGSGKSFSIDSCGRLIGEGDLVYTGLQIIKTDALHSVTQPAFSLLDIWLDMLDRGQLYGIEHPGGWCDVGYPSGIELAETMLREADHV